MTRVPGRRKGVFLSGAEASSRETLAEAVFARRLAREHVAPTVGCYIWLKVMTDESVRIYAGGGAGVKE